MINILGILLSFWGANRIATDRGRPSPAWGLGAATLCVMLQVLSEITGPPVGFHEIGRLIFEITIVPFAIGTACVVGFALLLPRIDRRAAEKTTRIPYRKLGWVLLFLAVAYPVLVFVRLFVSGPSGTAGATQVSPWLSMIILGLLSTGSAFLHLGRRAEHGRNAAKAAYTKVSVLVLRSFSVDYVKSPRRRLFGKLPWRWSGPDQAVDEQIAPGIETQIGPVVTIGSPDDYLPPLGAHRIYVPDAEWRRRIAELARLADWVLVVEGTGDGLAWELAWLRKHISPGRVLILTLPSEFRKNGGRQWPQLRRVAAGLGYGLPWNNPGPGCLIRFDESWTGHVILRDAVSGEELAAAIKQHGEPHRDVASALPPPPEVEEVLDVPDGGARSPAQPGSRRESLAGMGLVTGAAVGAVIAFWPPDPVQLVLPDDNVRMELPGYFAPPKTTEEIIWGFGAGIPVRVVSTGSRRAEIVLSARRLALGDYISLSARADRARYDLSAVCTETGAPVIEDTAAPAYTDLFFGCRELDRRYDLRLRVIAAGSRTVRLAMLTKEGDSRDALWEAANSSIKIGADPPPGVHVLGPPAGPAFYYFPSGQLARYDIGREQDEILLDHVNGPLALENPFGDWLALIGEDQILWWLHPQEGKLERGPQLVVADKLEQPARGAWSPGGDLLALFYPHWWGEDEIVALNRHRGLRVVDPATGVVQHYPAVTWFIGWRSPQEVLHQRADDEGRIVLYTLYVKTGEERVSDVADIPDGFFGFHRVGDRAVYLEVVPRPGESGEYDNRLMLMDLETLDAGPVPGIAPGRLGTPRLSPDGSQILFRSCPPPVKHASLIDAIIAPPSKDCLLRTITLEGRPGHSRPVDTLDEGRWLDADTIVVSGGRQISVLRPGEASRELPLEGYVIGTL